MVSCCRLPGVRAFVLEVRSRSSSKGSCKSPPKQIFSVLTSKGKVRKLSKLSFHPPRSRSWLRGGVPTGWVIQPWNAHLASSLDPLLVLIKWQTSAGRVLSIRHPDPPSHHH